jgi:hypothetical protein
MNETRQRALSVDIVTDLALAGLRWRGLATRSRAALGINPLALRLGCEVLSLDWDRQGRVTPAQRMRKTCPATSQEAWPEAESLAMKDSLGREPWWNADRCAPGDPGAAVADATAE